MNAPELSSSETSELRCGLPGPWSDLLPLMLGPVAQQYVHWHHRPFPAEFAEGPPAGFAPARARRADTGVRQRGEADLVPQVEASRRRGYRSHATPRGHGSYITYGVAERGTSPLAEPRELTETEIADVYSYRPIADGVGENYAPIRDYVIRVVLNVGRYSAGHPKPTQSVVARYVDWAYRIMGTDLDDAEIFDRDLIAYYAINVVKDRAPKSYGAVRGRLLTVANHLLPADKRLVKLQSVPHQAYQAPYSAEEIGALKLWASSSSTPYMRHCCWVLLTYCLGAGLTPADLGTLRGRNIVETPEGVIIHVGGKNPRQVAMLAEWEDYAIVLAEAVEPDAYLFRPESHGGKHAITTDIINRTRTQAERFGTRVNTKRMRITWYVRLLNSGVGLNTFIAAAGLKTPSSLDRVIPYLDEEPYEAAVAALRAYDSERKAQYREANRETCNQIRRERNALKKQMGIEGAQA